MNPPPTSRSSSLLILPALLGAWVAFTVLATFAARLTYPYDLEWMEGGVLAHAWRFQEGKGVYVRPSPDFVPMIYPPGYSGLLAVLGYPFGLSHALGRAVSVLGTLSACAAYFYAAKRHLSTGAQDRSWLWWGGIASAVFLGFYERSGAFYDLVRPDGLHVGLLTWSIVLAAETEMKWLRLSGLLLCASFIIKHNAGIYGFPLALAVWARHDWRTGLQWGLFAAVPALLFVIGMQLATDGLFLTWLLTVPSTHPMMDDRFIPGMVREFAANAVIPWTLVAVWMWMRLPIVAPRVPVPLLTVIPLMGGAAAAMWFSAMPPVEGIARPHPAEAFAMYVSLGVGFTVLPLAGIGMLLSGRFPPMVVKIAGLCAVGWLTAGLMRAHFGGFINVFMTLHWLTAAMLVIAAADFVGTGKPLHQAAAILAVTAHLGFTIVDAELDRLVPTEEDRKVGDEVVAYLAKKEGPVFSPFNPWLAKQAGHEPGYHLIALWDIRHENGPFQKDVARLMQAIADGYYGVIVDSDKGAMMNFKAAYHRARNFLPENDRDFAPKTGWRARPNIIWLPRKDPEVLELLKDGAAPEPPDVEVERPDRGGAE